MCATDAPFCAYGVPDRWAANLMAGTCQPVNPEAMKGSPAPLSRQHADSPLRIPSVLLPGRFAGYICFEPQRFIVCTDCPCRDIRQRLSLLT